MAASQLASLAHGAGATWHCRLRRSARLYLAMSDPAAPPLEVEARLRLVERHLLRHLLRAAPGQCPLAASLPEARAIVEAAQAALLTSAAAVGALLRELSVAQAISPTPGGAAEREWLY